MQDFAPLPREKVLVDMAAITERLSRLLSWHSFQDANGLPPKEEQPLRAELYSVEQLERHARELARSHQLATGRAPDKLIARLLDNEGVLVDSYQLVTAAAKPQAPVCPGGRVAAR